MEELLICDAPISYVGTCVYAYDAAIRKIPKNSRHVTWPEEASRMRCDTIAIKNSRYRRPELFN